MSILSGQQTSQALTNKDSGAERQSVFMSFFQRYSRYIVIGEVVLIGLSGYLFLVKPKIDSIRSLSEAATEREEKIQAEMSGYNREAGALQEIVSRYRNLTTEELEAINALLPDGPDLQGLMTQINVLVKSNGLLLSSMSFAEDAADSPQTRGRVEITEKAPSDKGRDSQLAEVLLTVKVTGASYPGFKNFLAALENNLRIIDAQSVKYDPKSGAIELTLKTYYLTPSS